MSIDVDKINISELTYLYSSQELCILFSYIQLDRFRDKKVTPLFKTMAYNITAKDNHKFIESSGSPIKGMVTLANEILIMQLFGNDKPLNKLKKDKQEYRFNYIIDGESFQSAPLNYGIISKSIRDNGYFDNEAFSLPKNHSNFGCFWMDAIVEIGMGFHFDDGKSEQSLGIHDGTPAAQYGKDYPISPKIDREGQIITSLQPELFNRISKARLNLIENSHEALTTTWVLELRSIIIDTISLIDITLNQIYIKAMYSKLDSWKFNKEVVGSKHGRRFNDKLKWIKQITGKNLNIEEERESLNNLRMIRNHMSHFDPPSLAITIEEATDWINQVIDIGVILIKMRKAIGVPISFGLVNFILQEEAIFKPISIRAKRKPLSSENGYRSSIWSKESQL